MSEPAISIFLLYTDSYRVHGSHHPSSSLEGWIHGSIRQSSAPAELRIIVRNRRKEDRGSGWFSPYALVERDDAHWWCPLHVDVLRPLPSKTRHPIYENFFVLWKPTKSCVLPQIDNLRIIIRVALFKDINRYFLGRNRHLLLHRAAWSITLLLLGMDTGRKLIGQVRNFCGIK